MIWKDWTGERRTDADGDAVVWVMKISRSLVAGELWSEHVCRPPGQEVELGQGKRETEHELRGPSRSLKSLKYHEWTLGLCGGEECEERNGKRQLLGEAQINSQIHTWGLGDEVGD